MRNELEVFFSRKIREKIHLYRYGLVIAYLILMTLMMPRAFRLNYQYEIGKKWETSTLYAPFDFAIYKSKDSLEREKKLLSRQVLDIYRLDSTVEEEVLRETQVLFGSLEVRANNFLEAQANMDTLAMNRYRRAFSQLNLTGVSIEMVLRTNFIRLRSATKDMIERVYQRGYVDLRQPQDSASLYVSVRYRPGAERYVPIQRLITSKDQISQLISDTYPDLKSEEKQVLRSILSQKVKPNLRFDAKDTERAKSRKRSLVSPVKEKVQAGELIIKKGSVVTGEDASKIESLIIELKRQDGGENTFLTFFSQFLIVLIITSIMLAYLWFNKPRLYFDYKKLGLLLFTFLLVVGAMVVSTKLTDLAERLSDVSPAINLSYIYLAPACIVPIFISSFFDYRLALQANLLVALYGAVLIQQGLEFAFVQTVAGTMAVYSLRKLRKRDTFFITLGYIFLAYSLAYIAFNLLSKGSFVEINYRTLLIFGINVVLTVITYNLIYLMERVFGVTSDLTYLELLDTNYPLLQELSRKAPGTFQHSLQVANIAEATIKEIGGNALLTHVGALYHDIGKMGQPNFFIENMSEQDKEQNPHEKLNCEESAEIIIGHVRRGVEMAQKYHLPREIIDFIKMHHGTTRVEFFYRRYLRENQCEAPEAEELFRYHGPLPNSKETAVLMISDSIEAASRSLKNPTQEKLYELVDSIINHKIKDHQLEESNLTFKDISRIRSVIKKQLMSIFHGRIEYPKEEEEKKVAKEGSKNN